jgi:hypothetical protein
MGNSKPIGITQKSKNDENGTYLKYNMWLDFNNTVYSEQTYKDFVKRLTKFVKTLNFVEKIEGYITDLKIRQKYTPQCYLTIEITSTSLIDKEKRIWLGNKIENFVRNNVKPFALV